MKKDFIRIGDQDFRVEVNMNTAEEWERLSGKRLGQFESEAAKSIQSGGVATRDILLWFYCAIKQGEQMEGKDYELDFFEFKQSLRPAVVSQFSILFVKQYMGENSAVTSTDDNPPKKKKQRYRLMSLFSAR